MQPEDRKYSKKSIPLETKWKITLQFCFQANKDEQSSNGVGRRREGTVWERMNKEEKKRKPYSYLQMSGEKIKLSCSDAQNENTLSIPPKALSINSRLYISLPKLGTNPIGRSLKEKKISANIIKSP